MLACLRACVLACLRACVLVCLRACVHVHPPDVCVVEVVWFDWRVGRGLQESPVRVVMMMPRADRALLTGWLADWLLFLRTSLHHPSNQPTKVHVVPAILGRHRSGRELRVPPGDAVHANAVRAGFLLLQRGKDSVSGGALRRDVRPLGVILHGVVRRRVRASIRVLRAGRI